MELGSFPKSMLVRDPNAFQHLPKDSGQPTCGRFHRHAETDGVRREDPAYDLEATSPITCPTTLAALCPYDRERCCRERPASVGTESEDLCGQPALKACPTLACSSGP